MTPRANADVLRELLDAVGERDLPRLVALTDPDVTWRSFFAGLLPKGEYRGHDGLREYVDDLGDTLSLRPELTDAVESGDVVVGVGRIHYRGRESGVEAESPAGWMLRLRAGKVVRFRAFKDPERALEVVGELGDTHSDDVA